MKPRKKAAKNSKKSKDRVAIHHPIQMPIQVSAARKNDMRSQFGALVYRVKNDKIQILLITSRTRGRWIIPKGWPMIGETPADAAATEAWEEAGVKGKVYDRCLGLYSYTKRREDQRDLPCLVMIYPIKAKKLSDKFPEAGQRRRKWFSRKKAAKLVSEPELAKMIGSFDPRHVK